MTKFQANRPLAIDRASVILEEEGDASGLTKHHVQRAKKFGGGYFVNVEGLHHLHCLVCCIHVHARLVRDCEHSRI